MVSWIVLIVLLVIFVAVLSWLLGMLFGRGEAVEPLAASLGLMSQNADAVRRGDLESVRFDTVLRGYRQDQVDAVIGELEQQVRELRSRALPRRSE
ncbi:putative secreted protein [Corynebacterium ulcerans 809]|uniref:DivIVA domain-containing protein n=1 Tax=Corynebacterium ulcerans TaxID=65058 RepID=UPI00021850E8|nr:DivIVA domain-containing protein [Corynebacterium ulcerans]AEG81365.1 putative secreted protein [Corynebacterium ulcerans 809]